MYMGEYTLDHVRPSDRSILCAGCSCVMAAQSIWVAKLGLANSFSQLATSCSEGGNTTETVLCDWVILKKSTTNNAALALVTPLDSEQQAVQRLERCQGLTLALDLAFCLSAAQTSTCLSWVSALLLKAL